MHGDAETHKRTGDLLLANLSTAERRGAQVTLTDYYAEGEPRIEIEVDENSTLQEEAARLSHATAKPNEPRAKSVRDSLRSTRN
jgi:predicted ribosome quality control (RQC) complex YloA/Tae2 family protein